MEQQKPLKVSKKKNSTSAISTLTTKLNNNNKKKVGNGKNSSKNNTQRNEKTITKVLKSHPFLRNHRPIYPCSSRKYTLIEGSHPRKISLSKDKLPFYGFGRSKLDRPLPKEFNQFLNGPSKLITSRYEGCSRKLANLLQNTHLTIPKVPMIKWEPCGSWKSVFEGNRKRKASTNITPQEQPPKKISKVDKKSIKKNNKLGPLKITIRKDSSDADEICGASKKKKILSMITPIPKDIDYVKIRSNIIVESPPKLTPASKPCECEDSDPCTSTSKCLSRAAQIECTHYSCQLFDTCQNRRLESNLSVHQLQIFKHPTMNHGVRSLTDISKDQLVCEFVGEIMRKNTYLKRLETAQTFPHYGIELIPGSYVIDASKKGNLSRFMNHSCQPNCIMQRWIVRGEQRIGIFALTNIEAGVELTYNYSMHVFLKEQIKCLCESESCQGTLPTMPPPTKAPSKVEKLSKAEIQMVKKEKIFLQRNLRKYNTEREIAIPSTLSSMPEISKCISDIFNQFIHSCDKLPRRWLQYFSITTRKVFATFKFSFSSDVVELIEKFDANIKCCLSQISKSLERRQSDTLQQQYLQIKRQSNISEFLKDSHPNTLLSFIAERPRNRKNDHSPRILSATTDLSYMNSEYPVGSYDPDKESLLFSQKCCPDGDSIRCVCGIMDEGGKMYQCDQCHYWLHQDCLGLSNDEPDEYVCPFCEKNLKTTPLLDILLTPQYDYRIDNCVYYKTLVNCRGIQIRINECVYVERIINDEYKRRLKKFHEDCVDEKTKRKKRKLSTIELPPNVEEPSESIFKPDVQRIYDRKDLRTFRIERLFKVPTGERYAFGCYYARPHETFVDPGRTFYKNELFWTPLFDTLPLDVIVGRCLCLEPQEYAIGRPKGPKYLEDDIFVCEYSIDKTQKVFEKISLKNRYHINMAEYLFDRFDKSLTMKRNFTGTIRLHQCMNKFTSKP
uniref:Histone-lysine N-methyltransferase n=1 Tax=Panagrolaimus superbus TaxID=310955 RepID=A0A914ZC83_9BILA